MLASMALAAFVTSVPLMIWEIAAGGFVWPTPAGLATLVYAAPGPAFAAQIFFIRGVELIGPGRAGLFVNLVPAFGAIMAVVLLGERFAVYHVVALALVVVGVAIAQRGAPR
jgi:drug/metabolite transporter (DMT)-like permease